uniref:hypothetical protein n=1 Tax=Alloprevotella sp. TaxID=1872471 RepID=UPI003FF054CE
MDNKARSVAKRYVFKQWAKANRKTGSFYYNYDVADRQLTRLYDDSAEEVIKLLGGDDTASNYYCGNNDCRAVDPCDYCHVALKQSGDQLCAGCRLWADNAEEWQKAVADNIYQLVSYGRQNMENKTAEKAQALIVDRDIKAHEDLQRIAKIANSSHARRIHVKTAEELEQEAERHADDYDTWAQSGDTSADDMANSRFQL